MRLLLPKSLASAGWDIVKSRRDVEGILFDDEDPPESLHPALRAVDGVALGHTHFGQAEIDAAPRLRVVGRIGVGYDNVDVAALTRRGIPLMMTDTANSVSVAEHTLAFMLALAKKIVEMDAMVHNGHWHERLMRGHIDLFGKGLSINNSVNSLAPENFFGGVQSCSSSRRRWGDMMMHLPMSLQFQSSLPRIA
jgi:D-3-phosphoglycerate dehydrogenase